MKRQARHELNPPIRLLLTVAASSILLLTAFQQSSSTLLAQSTVSDSETLIIEDVGQSEVVAFGKSLIIKGRVKNAFVFGGDATVEGEVAEDVAWGARLYKRLQAR